MSEARKAPCGCGQILVREGYFDEAGAWRAPEYQTMHEFGKCDGPVRVDVGPDGVRTYYFETGEWPDPRGGRR